MSPSPKNAGPGPDAMVGKYVTSLKTQGNSIYQTIDIGVKSKTSFVTSLGPALVEKHQFLKLGGREGSIVEKNLWTN